MMIIRLTQKLAKKIKAVPTAAEPRSENPFADWSANLFTVGRTQYIILTHSATLYSVVFPGRGINGSDSFIDQALAALREQMTDAGHGDIFQSHIASLAGNVRFSKTGDRSLLGSLNDLVQHAQLRLADEPPAAVATKLNKIPMGALEYRFPRDDLVKLAELAPAEEAGGGKLLPFPGTQGKERDAALYPPERNKTGGQTRGDSKNRSKAASKTPAQKRAETMKFQREMRGMFDQLRKPKSKRQRLDEAQTLICDAWESSPARAAKLARRALEMSADCADAYVLLADLEAATIRERIELLRQGVAAGRRALGKKFFKEDEGHFWLELDSRPFMRALAALAGILWEIGQAGEAIGIWNEMLRLNPNDNQGVRYALLSCLLELKRNDEAVDLVDAYSGDVSADWAYGCALLSFRMEGDTKEACQVLSTALRQNPHVPSYLLGSKKVPKRLPKYISMGEEDEAVSYAAANRAGWAKTPGALEWLAQRWNG